MTAIRNNFLVAMIPDSVSKFVEKPKHLVGFFWGLHFPNPLSHYKELFPEREGMARDCLSGHFTLSQVGDIYNKSYATVSREIKVFEQSKK